MENSQLHGNQITHSDIINGSKSNHKINKLENILEQIKAQDSRTYRMQWIQNSEANW